MPELDGDNSWDRYQKLIISELERLGKAIAEVDRKFDTDRNDKWEAMRKIEIKVAMLEVKCGMWGALGGVATAVGTMLLQHLGSK